MEFFGKNILGYISFSFLACTILQFLNYARQLLVKPKTHEVPALTDSLVHRNCNICLTPTSFRCSWWKSVRYCSPKCYLIHWREGRKKECQTLNESVTAATGVKPQQTPHIHGSKTKQFGSLVGKSEKQSSTEDDADPDSFLSQDGTSISKSVPENHNGTRGLTDSGKVNESSVKGTNSKFQSITDLEGSLNERIGSWLFGKTLNKWNSPAKNLVQDYEQAKNAFEVYQDKVETKMAHDDKLKPDFMVKEVKVKVSAEPEEPTLRDEMLSHKCATCSAPTKTRCARCKSIHYCSEKCQLRHWRSGHKEKCKPFSKPTTAASRPKSPMQKHSPDNFNLLPYGIDTNKYGILEGPSHDQFGIQTQNIFINGTKKRAVSKLKETKLKGENSANRNSSYFNSLEGPFVMPDYSNI